MTADSTRAPDGATTLTTKDDAELIAAWATYNEARGIYNDAPHEGPYIDGYNAIEREQLAIMEPAEKLIGEATPVTLRGIEIQLWMMLVHSADSQHGANYARAENLDACADLFDWIDGHALNAIRAIRALIAKEGGAK